MVTGEIVPRHKKSDDCISLGWFGNENGFFSQSPTMPITKH